MVSTGLVSGLSGGFRRVSKRAFDDVLEVFLQGFRGFLEIAAGFQIVSRRFQGGFKGLFREVYGSFARF